MAGLRSLSRVDLTLKTISSAANLLPDVGTSRSQIVVTAQAVAGTVGVPNGTPKEADSLTLRMRDAGAAQTITWNAIYRPVGVTLPTVTVANKLLYVGMYYNAVDSKWDVVAINQEA